MKTLKTLSLLSIVLCLTYCDGNNNDQSANQIAAIPVEPINSESSDNTTPEATKTEADAYLEAGTAIINLAANAIDNKRLKDSLRLANKEKMYAYQIGLPMKEKETVFEVYKKLQETGIKGIYALKNPDDDYILVQYEAKDQADLYANLQTLKTSLTEITTEKIEVVNLMDFCNKKDIIKTDGKLTKRKEDVEIPCLICD